jgi:radical SAM superfamily enzyme YgiQ (UPF0313 family)
MRVLLVAANTERINMPTPPLGAAMVAAAARAAGHRVELLDLLRTGDPVAAVAEAVRRFEPEVIGVSVRNIDDQNMRVPAVLLDRARDVVATCREASAAPIVLGGAGYSIFPGPALAALGADFGIAGEGELAFVRLLDTLAGGGDPAGVGGVWVAGGGPAAPRLPPADMDALPSPYVELDSWLELDDPELWVPVQTGRGCAFDCTYCSTPQIEGRVMRRRSPERVVEDVSRLAAAGARRLHFVDNVFNLPPSYALELCRRLAELDVEVGWRCIAYPHRVGEELVTAMAAAGCREVSVGSESGCDRVLESLNKRFTADEVRRATAMFAASGIDAMGFLLLGVPGETRESVAESLDFARSLPLSTLKITVGARIYPYTPLAAQAVAEGVVSPDDDLLEPRFYLAPEVGDGFIEDEVAAREWPMRVIC